MMGMCSQAGCKMLGFQTYYYLGANQTNWLKPTHWPANHQFPLPPKLLCLENNQVSPFLATSTQFAGFRSKFCWGSGGGAEAWATKLIEWMGIWWTTILATCFLFQETPGGLPLYTSCHPYLLATSSLGECTSGSGLVKVEVCWPEVQSICHIDKLFFKTDIHPIPQTQLHKANQSVNVAVVCIDFWKPAEVVVPGLEPLILLHKLLLP